MILNEEAVYSMAQASANRDNRNYQIYQRANGTYIFCAEGMFNLVKQTVLNTNEQVKFIDTVKPNEIL